jgi:hypothetical protein
MQSPTRAPSAVPVDDAVLPFEVDALDLRGRLTRLGPALDDILTRHDYPPPVGKLLGEAIVLTTLLGSSLKFDGRFILQTQTDGPVSFLIVDFQAPDRLRAYARFDAKRLRAGQDSGALLGKGHLAMTIDQGPDMSRYQGLVALEGGNLEDKFRPGCDLRSARNGAAVTARGIAGEPAACCCSSCPSLRSGPGGRICIRAMRRRAPPATSSRTMMHGSRARH